jgi:hypothetical protein
MMNARFVAAARFAFTLTEAIATATPKLKFSFINYRLYIDFI